MASLNCHIVIIEYPQYLEALQRQSISDELLELLELDEIDELDEEELEEEELEEEELEEHELELELGQLELQLLELLQEQQDEEELELELDELELELGQLELQLLELLQGQQEEELDKNIHFHLKLYDLDMQHLCIINLKLITLFLQCNFPTSLMCWWDGWSVIKGQRERLLCFYHSTSVFYTITKVKEVITPAA